MALDSSVDVPLSTMAALIRAALPVTVAADALALVVEDPRDLENLASTKLPALALYRTDEIRSRVSSVRTVQVITVQFEYILPATGLDKRTVRWPVLQRAWNAIVDLLLAGGHESVDDGANVLELAGVDLHGDSFKVKYGFAAHGGKSYPSALGTCVIEFSDDAVDALTLDKFLSLHASYDLVQTEETADTPSQPGVSTDEGPVETTLDDFEIADILPGADDEDA